MSGLPACYAHPYGGVVLTMAGVYLQLTEAQARHLGRSLTRAADDANRIASALAAKAARGFALAEGAE